LLSHAPRLVTLYVKPLLDCLHAKVCEHRNDVPFASSIVTVVGQLASQSGAETVQHFDTIVPFLIESMQDFYYVQLKHTALWTLGQIVANTGYVIEPYKKYPNLLGILLGFLLAFVSVRSPVQKLKKSQKSPRDILKININDSLYHKTYPGHLVCF
jgi:FKBP12-rapamycin complex-associated protein